MSDAVTLQATPADFQRIEQQMALEILGLRRELAVCVRTINELRAANFRVTEERNALERENETLMDLHGQAIRDQEQAEAPARTGRKK